MSADLYEIESKTLFSESKIWQLNKDFYNFRGITAFSEDIVPHQLTSNSRIGKTYAELIFGFLKDRSEKGKTEGTVHILELGAGHGRLAFHTLFHLEKLLLETTMILPEFCYVLSDIAEDSLSFFLNHPQLKPFFEKGKLDVAFFDATESQSLELRYSKKTIQSGNLEQPIIAVANYFFDSIPNALYHIKDSVISSSSISLHSTNDPAALDPAELIHSLEISYHNTPLAAPYSEDPVSNEILESYKDSISDAHIFFPDTPISCISSLRRLSKEGLLLLSLDKGFHETEDLNKRKEPDLVTHGSYSIWVNYHALGLYCEKQGGKAMFPAHSTFHLELACMMFLEDSETYIHTAKSYEKHVNDFGPDDYNTMKQQAYANVARLNSKDLLALFRLNAYDSSFFVKMLPRLKQVAKSITYNERKRIAECMHKVWESYFSISEPFDLPYEIGSIFYDLGFYEDALVYFQHSEDLHGPKPDTYYNKALSYYQLRMDKVLAETIIRAKKAFPDYKQFDKLEKLDLSQA